MRFLWRLAAPSTEDREKNDGSPFTWKDYPSKLFKMIRMRHSGIKLLIFVNDPYDLDVCIKYSEDDRRNAKKPTFVVRKTLSSERMKHFQPERMSMTFSRISQTIFALNSS